MQLTQCPEPVCEGPAEILDRFVLPSTEGFVEFVRVLCLHRHWFMLPVSSLKPCPPRTLPPSDAPQSCVVSPTEGVDRPQGTK